MIRPMKWHIYGDGYPLCWDDQAMEWDTEEAARADWELMKLYTEPAEHLEIKQGILYYDGGYLDMSKYHIEEVEDGDDFLTLVANE